MWSRKIARPSRMIALYRNAAARAPDDLALAAALGRVYFELEMLDEATEQPRRRQEGRGRQGVFRDFEDPRQVAEAEIAHDDVDGHQHRDDADQHRGKDAAAVDQRAVEAIEGGHWLGSHKGRSQTGPYNVFMISG